MLYPEYNNVIFDYFPELKDHGYAIKIYIDKTENDNERIIKVEGI